MLSEPMDLSSSSPSPTPTPTPTTTKITPEDPDTDSRTPPPPPPPPLLLLPQPIKSLSFTNGSLINRHQPPPQPQNTVVSYRECLKNHAATIGGHAVDGCGEFMPSPSAIPSDPTSLKCAACGCHRNFHRRHHHHVDAEEHLPKTCHVSSASFFNNKNNQLQFQLLPSPPFQPRRNSSPSPSLSPGRSSSPGPTPSPTPSPHSPPPVSHLPPNSYFASPPQMLLALRTTGLSRSSDEQYHSFNPTAPKTTSTENNNNNINTNIYSNARKRFRTKFSREQKEKMCLFAEKVGWKMQRSEEKAVEEFCKEVGVRKGVLKVWMHNNKHTLGKRSSSSSSLGGGLSTNNNVNNGVNNDHHDDEKDDDHDQDAKANFNFFANGSSSSS